MYYGMLGFHDKFSYLYQAFRLSVDFEVVLSERAQWNFITVIMLYTCVNGQGRKRRGIRKEKGIYCLSV